MRLYSTLILQSATSPKAIEISYKISPFKHNVGWDKLKPILEKAGYRQKIDFLFGDKYQTTSLLSFYSPGQQRAYFLNLNGIRNNQFTYWPQISDDYLGKDGYFVVIENIPQLNLAIPTLADRYTELLTPYFKRVELIGIFPLFESYGKMVKGAIIFKGIEYNGKEPASSNLF